MSTQDAAGDPVGTMRGAGVAARSRPTTAPLSSLRRRGRAALSLAALSLVVAPLLAGCGAIGARDESSGSGGEPGVVGEAPGQDGGDLGGGESGGGESGGDGSGGGDSPAEDREIVITGSLYVTVEDPLEAADEAARIVERAGGRVDGRRESAPRAGGSSDGTSSGGDVEYAPDYSVDEYGGGYGGYVSFGSGGGAVLELRIPSARLTETLDDLEALGEREELVLSSDDVTFERRDLTARISALESSVARLLALQDAAADLDDLIALESAISDRQAELESLQAQERYYEDQVSLSTITLTLGSEDVAPVDEPDSFWTGLTTGWDALLAFLGGALVVAGVLLPWLIVVGLLALVAWASLRRARLRRAKPTSDAQPVSTSAGSDA